MFQNPQDSLLVLIQQELRFHVRYEGVFHPSADATQKQGRHTDPLRSETGAERLPPVSFSWWRSAFCGTVGLSLPLCEEGCRSPAGQWWTGDILLPASCPSRSGGAQKGWGPGPEPGRGWSWPFLLFLQNFVCGCSNRWSNGPTAALTLVPICGPIRRAQPQEGSTTVPSTRELGVCSLIFIMIVNPAMSSRTGMFHSSGPWMCSSSSLEFFFFFFLLWTLRAFSRVSLDPNWHSRASKQRSPWQSDRQILQTDAKVTRRSRSQRAYPTTLRSSLVPAWFLKRTALLASKGGGFPAVSVHPLLFLLWVLVVSVLVALTVIVSVMSAVLSCPDSSLDT